MASLSLCFITFILLLVKVQGRVLKLNSSDNYQLLNISYGIDQLSSNQEFRPPLLTSSGKTCHQVYGVFPCANNIAGYIFLIGVYQYLLNTGERLLSRGSETLFNILDTGIYGATIFQILKALPRIIMVIASGVTASKQNAQNQISSGISTTAGATVFNLTLMWGICVIYGTRNITDKPDLQPAESSPFKRLKDFRHTGVIIDKKTSYTAGIMLLSLIPFVLVQPVTAFNSFLGRRILIFITLAVSLILLVSYFLYQFLNPWMQKRSLEYSKYENLLAGFLHHVQRHARGKLINEKGEPNIDVIKGLFHETDRDASKFLTPAELENLALEIQSGKAEVDKDYALSRILKSFDRNGDKRIQEEEFVEGCKNWIEKATQLAQNDDPNSKMILGKAVEQGTKKQKKYLLTWKFNKSVLQVLLGIAILTICAKPLVINIEDFSNAVGIPSFLIPFVMVPLALNARMAIAAIFPASQKSSKTASLTFSEIYGGVIMNNILGMATLLAVVCIKDLRWHYSAEVLIILVVCSAIGLLAFFSTTYPLWTCFLAFSLYPFSVVLLYLFESVLGWT